MRIETSRLILRNFCSEDADDLFDYLSKPSIYTFEPGSPITREHAIDEAIERAKSHVFIAVERKEDGKMIGHLYFDRHKYEAIRTYFLGYIFNPSFQKQGYCTEACSALIQYAFTELDAHRIEAKCSTENLASNKVLEKLGMRLEGTMKKNVYFHMDSSGNPIWFDSNIYAMLAEDYNDTI